MCADAPDRRPGDTVMEDNRAIATQRQIAHFSEPRPYRDPLRVAAIAPEDGPDSALEPRQSSGGPRITRSTALREPTACRHMLHFTWHVILACMQQPMAAWSAPARPQALESSLGIIMDPNQTPTETLTLTLT